MLPQLINVASRSEPTIYHDSEEVNIVRPKKEEVNIGDCGPLKNVMGAFCYIKKEKRSGFTPHIFVWVNLTTIYHILQNDMYRGIN